MKRHLSQLCLLAAATLAAPGAFADSVVVKCVDGAGRITLTDRPCQAGAASVRMDGSAPDRPSARQDVVPPPRAAQRRSLPLAPTRTALLASDVATLKAARAQFLLGAVDGSKQELADLE